jgi:hypothetical protein
VGVVTDWWSIGASSSSSASTLWADRFDMSQVPYLVDTDALVLKRHVQVSQVMMLY